MLILDSWFNNCFTAEKEKKVKFNELKNGKKLAKMGSLSSYEAGAYKENIVECGKLDHGPEPIHQKGTHSETFSTC